MTYRPEPDERLCRFRLLSTYRGGPDQASAADRDNNDKISDAEVLQSLFFFKDEKDGRTLTKNGNYEGVEAGRGWGWVGAGFD